MGAADRVQLDEHFVADVYQGEQSFIDQAIVLQVGCTPFQVPRKVKISTGHAGGGISQADGSYGGFLTDGKNNIGCRFSVTLSAQMVAALRQYDVLLIDDFRVTYFRDLPMAELPLRVELYINSFDLLMSHGAVGNRYVGEPDPTWIDAQKYKIQVPPPSAAPRQMFSWGEVDDAIEPIRVVECDGGLCGESETGFVQSECVVHTAIQRYRHHSSQPGEQEGVAGLPAYNSPDLIHMNRWARDMNTIQINAMTPGHRRFMLYYWFARDLFGCVDRIRLPDCVVAAVRSKYPNERGTPYVGHISRCRITVAKLIGSVQRAGRTITTDYNIKIC
jgi:hypothetical protein